LAAQNGHREVFRWARAHGAPMNVGTRAFAKQFSWLGEDDDA
jgi:hypothetical protein